VKHGYNSPPKLQSRRNGRRDPGSVCRRFLWLLSPLLLLLPLAVSLSQSSSRFGKSNLAPHTKSQAKSDYVGSEKCSFCHWKIYNDFKQTDMARTTSNVTPAFLQSVHLPATYYDPRTGRHYDVFTRNSELFQSQFQLDPSGKEVFRDTHQVRWIIGAGANVFGGIIARGDFLFEAPLAFYTKPESWGVEPGYESTDLGFNRPILAGCLACHASRSNPIPATNGKYGVPVFTEMGIGCERCHGPGAAHIAAMMKGESPTQANLHIVNPARLTPELANNLCMSCHEIGDARILNPGTRFQDYVPGIPLAHTFAILMAPPTRENPPQSDHLEHYYEMTLSKCYRATSGGLRCITCHDPHIEPTAVEAPAVFNAKCLTCHTRKSCTQTLAVRRHTTPSDNCIGCHMPKRPVQVIQHASLTNHRILARPNEPFPDAAFEQTTTALPDLIFLNPVPGKYGVPPPPLTLLQAYGELAAYRPEYVQPYLKSLKQLSQSDPENELVQAALGRRDLLAAEYQSAVGHLRKALRIGPPQAVVYGDLAQAEYRLGRKDEAVALLRKGVDQDPYNPLLRRKLIHLLLQLKQEPEAQRSLERYLEIFPQDSSMRAVEAQFRAPPAKR
jgi:Tetratricopeptide repeat/Cytochrome c554 and c-prime